MSFDDRTANRQPQTNPVSPRGVERVKYLVFLAGRQAFSVVGDREFDSRRAGRARPNAKSALLRRCFGHRVKGVKYQIQQDLLDLNGIAMDLTQSVRQRRVDGDLTALRFVGYQSKHAASNFICVGVETLLLAFANVAAQAANCVGSTLRFARNIVQD